MTRWFAVRVAAVVVALLMSACAPTSTAGARPSAPAPPPIVYAALGASETYGVGADDRYRQAWPQIFYNDALPPSAVLYNFGIPGATTAQALKDEVPAAVAAHPTIATVWLNVNDLIQGVSAPTYEAQLRQVLHALRRRGQTRVLVANTPDLAELPAYRACLPNPPTGGPACLIPQGLLPTPQAVAAAVGAYNAAITEAAKQEGATVVDLHLDGAQITQHPEWLSGDGFHPSAQGYAIIAKLFEDAYGRVG